MKKLIPIVFVSTALACGGSHGQSSTANPQSVPTGWTSMNEKTTCEAMNPTSCAGAYGFTVTSDGHYTAGPDPNGQTKTGMITPAELSTLSALAQPVLNNGTMTNCDDNVGNVPGVSDIAKITPDGGTAFDFYRRPEPNSVNGACFTGGQSSAQNLHDELNALMKEYYPVPFPDTVANGAWGGRDVLVNVNPAGADVALHCSRGHMDQPLVLDQNNDFRVTGTLLEEQGPIVVGHPHTPRPTLYAGHVSGQTMQLNVQYVDDNGRAQNQNYTAVYGLNPTFSACPL